MGRGRERRRGKVSEEKYTACPRSSDPFYYSKLLYEMGHYFLDRQYQVPQRRWMRRLRGPFCMQTMLMFL